MLNRRAMVMITIAGIAISGGAAMAAASLARSDIPAGLDRSLDRATDRAKFHVRIASTTGSIPLHKVHQWRAVITDADGRPVTGAAIRVSGGMPQHGHGLPTAPTASPAQEPGSYVLNGVKFSMDGWWELKLTIAAGGVTDSVTFNIVL